MIIEEETMMIIEEETGMIIDEEMIIEEEIEEMKVKEEEEMIMKEEEIEEMIMKEEEQMKDIIMKEEEQMKDIIMKEKERERDRPYNAAREREHNYRENRSKPVPIRKKSDENYNRKGTEEIKSTIDHGDDKLKQLYGWENGIDSFGQQYGYQDHFIPRTNQYTENIILCNEIEQPVTKIKKVKQYKGEKNWIDKQYMVHFILNMKKLIYMNNKRLGIDQKYILLIQLI